MCDIIPKKKDAGRCRMANLAWMSLRLLAPGGGGEHRSVPEMHQRLQARGLAIPERAVTHLQGFRPKLRMHK